jgi:hypothetical protein
LNGQAIPNVTQANFTPTVSGNYTVIVTWGNRTFISAPKNIVITSLAQKMATQVNIFPNPSEGAFTLSVKDLRNAKVKIINTLGSAVLEQNLETDQTRIALPKGMYFLQIRSNEGAVNKQVIVQ